MPGEEDGVHWNITICLGQQAPRVRKLMGEQVQLVMESKVVWNDVLPHSNHTARMEFILKACPVYHCILGIGKHTLNIYTYSELSQKKNNPRTEKQGSHEEPSCIQRDHTMGDPTDPAPSSEGTEELPANVAEVKAKLEAETGKKYRYRPKDATPNIKHMMSHGAPEDEGRPRTWMETVGYPTILALLFAVTFFLFLKFVPPQTSPKFVLPTTKNAQLIQERRRMLEMQKQQQKSGEL